MRKKKVAENETEFVCVKWKWKKKFNRSLKMFASKSFSENNRKWRIRKWKLEKLMVTLRAEVWVKNHHITAVTRNGKLSLKFKFIFRKKYYLSGK